MRAALLVFLLSCSRAPTVELDRTDPLESRILDRIEELKLDARRYDALDGCLERKIPPTESLYQAKVGVLTCRTLARHAK